MFQFDLLGLYFCTVSKLTLIVGKQNSAIHYITGKNNQEKEEKTF